MFNASDVLKSYLKFDGFKGSPLKQKVLMITFYPIILIILSVLVLFHFLYILTRKIFDR